MVTEAARQSAHPRRGRARHLVLVGAVAVLDARLAGRDAGAQALLSDHRAGHRLRHHLLLGRPHDDDGAALHEGGAVPRRLHPRPRPRREGRQDVEVQGQRHRPAGADRRIRRRCAALHARRDGGAGPRHQALDPARRGLSQLRDQALERRALRRVQRRGARRRLRSEERQGDAQPLDRARDREGRARDHRGARRLQVQRGGGRGLSLRLERLLRLVRRTVQAVADRPGRRGQGRDPRDGGLGARRDPQAAASVHAVHHRGAVARHRRAGPQARRAAGALGLAEARRASTTPRPRPRSAG